MMPNVEQDVERARTLALRYGWNATAYQVVNPGICHWFSPDGAAIIGYMTRRGVRVVAGAPICDEERLLDVITAFEGEARRDGEKVCYFGAAGRVMHLLGDCSGYATVVLGAQPTWELPRWTETFEAVPSLRQQRARARNKGIIAQEWTPERAHDHPALRRLLNEWLKTRSLPPMHFLVEPETLERLKGRRIFVAVDAKNGDRPVAFVNCSPIPARCGWLTEQFVRGRGAVNGTIELLMDAAAQTLAAEGGQYLTMGLVPLSQNTWVPSDYNPLWLRGTLSWIRAHGRRFYNFDGLDKFKSKFRPHAWEPIYAISNEPRFSPRTLYAIADAFSHGSPISAVIGGLARALRQEWRWHWGRKKPGFD